MGAKRNPAMPGRAVAMIAGPRGGAVVLAALALLPLLAGCGGNGTSTSTSGLAREGGAAKARPLGASAEAKKEKPYQPDRDGAEGKPPNPARGALSPQSEEFSKFDGRHGLHLAHFGEEARRGRRGEAEAVIVAYLHALDSRSWNRACALLSAAVKAQVEQLAGLPGCERALARFVGSSHPSSGALAAPEGVSSLRLQKGEGSREAAGFALFHGGDGSDYWMALKAEGDRWTVLSATPQPFGGSGAGAG